MTKEEILKIIDKKKNPKLYLMIEKSKYYLENIFNDENEMRLQYGWTDFQYSILRKLVVKNRLTEKQAACCVLFLDKYIEDVKNNEERGVR